jgi:3,4-dihydroxy 2-butanone 4-phosphate synthase/GTP cyclohydrolase II
MKLAVDNAQEQKLGFNTIEEIIADFAAGKMVIMLDDEDRENEGDLLIAADKVQAEDINYMAKFGRGLICLTLTEQRCQQLHLPLMVTQKARNNAPFGTRFTVSVEAAHGVTTGISAKDRATTIQACINSNATPADIVQPGHIFPIMAQPGGVLTRAGHTEAGCDLARLSGFKSEAAVLVEILNEDGSMARRDDLLRFAAKHGLKIGTIADLIKYRLQHEKTIEQIATTLWPTEYGQFKLSCYLDHVTNNTHYALITSGFTTKTTPYIRVHVENKVVDLLRYQDQDSNRARTSWPLEKAMAFIAKQENGVILILANEQKDLDLLNLVNKSEHVDVNVKLNKSHEQRVLRRIGIGSQILNDLGVTKMKLLSEPVKYYGLSGFDLEVEQYIKYENNND